MAVDAVPWGYLVTVTHLALCFSLIVTAYFCTSSTDSFLQVSHSQLHVTDFCCWMLWWIACKRLATSALHVAIQTSNNIRDCTLHSTHTHRKKNQLPLIYNKQNRYRFKFNQSKGQCTTNACEINCQLYVWYPVIRLCLYMSMITISCSYNFYQVRWIDICTKIWGTITHHKARHRTIFLAWDI